MNKKILAVVAHPDDESFGIGGTLAKYAREGVEIHVLCATRGESGRGGKAQANQREQELMEASKILGVSRVEFMGLEDGTLCNNMYHEVARTIEDKIISFAPHVILTYEHVGVSGHIDHIVMSLATTFAVRNHKDRFKLFYFCELKEFAAKRSDYFVYFPPGYDVAETDVVIDTESVWETKVKAMHAHRSQLEDVKMILANKKNAPKREYFLEAFKIGKKRQRHDFFAS